MSGKYRGCEECHIKPNLLLIYKKQDDILVLTCLEAGSHSELFA
ncbi:type II toxin-antitoxin system mRNA interferase toxin, RelE/StbE family [Helicobacter sp. 11S02596-1]